MESNLIGKAVTITNRDHWAYDYTGIVKDYDGEYYYIAVVDDDTVLPFYRGDFKVRRIKR